MLENVTVQPFHDPDDRYGADHEPEEAPENSLDSAQAKQTLRRLQEWREQVRAIQAPNRLEQAIDDDYYDGLQWTEEEKQEIMARGQAPLVFNEIKPAIDWVLGTEKRTRLDWNVHPREENDREGAAIKKDLLKYVSDVNKAGFNRSRAFSDAVRVGVGWIEIGIRDNGDEPLFYRRESWRNVWYDPLSREMDLSDARFLIREKWVDLDVAIAMFPDRTAELEAAAVAHHMMTGDEDEFFDSMLYYSADSAGRSVGRTASVEDAVSSVGNRRSRVRLVETWFREPCACQVARPNTSIPWHPDEYRTIMQYSGMDVEHGGEDVRAMIKDGSLVAVNASKMKMFCAVHVDNTLLQLMPSPYRHDRFPFVPVWGYRRGRDNCAYGAIRNSRDPQDDLNKRQSKALYILSTNQVLMEKGAVEDIDLLRDEAADPAGVIEYKKGFAFQIRSDKALGSEHIQLAQRDADYVRHSSGVTGENLGQETNATSGKAIQARQLQGSVVTAELFDNLRLALQIEGEIMLSLIEQFYAAPKVIRIVGERGKLQFRKINMPAMNDEGLAVIENDITRTKADFIVDAQDFRESMRLAMFEQLSDMVARLPPEVAIQLLDLVFEMADLPGTEEMVRRVRKINGQTDPDKEDSPEEQQAQAAGEQAKQQAMELQNQTIIANLKTLLAKAKATEAEANSKEVDAIEKALQVAQQIAMAPQLAGMADNIIQSVKQNNSEVIPQ